MFYFIIVAFFITVYQKRNPFSFIRNISFEWPLVILVSFGTQILLTVLTIQTKEKFEWVFILTFVGVVIGLLKNRKIRGVNWIVTGAILNLLALLLHGGTMPVSKKALQLTGQESILFDTDARHHLMNESFFWILGDWIPLIRYVLSPGDFFAGIGIILLIVTHSEYRKGQGVVQ
jgi:hypothetical protein